MYGQHIGAPSEGDSLPVWTPLQSLEVASEKAISSQTNNRGIPPQQRRRKSSVYTTPLPGQLDQDLATNHVLASDILERNTAPLGIKSGINGILFHPGLLAKHGIQEDMIERESVASDSRSKKSSFLSVSPDSRSKKSSILSNSSEPRFKKNSTISISSDSRSMRSSTASVASEVRFKKNSIVSFCGLSAKENEEEFFGRETFQPDQWVKKSSVIGFVGDMIDRERPKKPSTSSLSRPSEEVTETENIPAEQRYKRSSVVSFSNLSVNELLENDDFDDNNSFMYRHERNGFVHSSDHSSKGRYQGDMKEWDSNSPEKRLKKLSPACSSGWSSKGDIENGIMVKERRLSDKRTKKHSTVSFSDLPVTYAIENDMDEAEIPSPKRRSKKHSTVSFSGLLPDDDVGETVKEKKENVSEQRTRKHSTVSFSGLSEKDLACDEDNTKEKESTSSEPRKRKLSPDSNYSGLLSSNHSIQSQDADKHRTKFRVLILVLLGSVMIGVCSLGFYSLVEARKAPKDIDTDSDRLTTPRMLAEVTELNTEWRDATTSCLTDTLNTCPEYFKIPPLVVIAISGLRPEMVNDTLTPALTFLRSCGVFAKSLVPVYPVLTSPNLYSIATGLYPDTHGNIDNFAYDPVGNETLHDTAHGRTHQWRGEPIWNTATKQEKKSAVYFWAGADNLINGRHPTYRYHYVNNKPLSVRTRQVVDWLTLPQDEIPHLTMVYYEEPLASMIKFGVNSKEAREALQEVDEQIDVMMKDLRSNELSHCVNFLIVSDHGVPKTDCTASSYLETFKTGDEDFDQEPLGSEGGDGFKDRGDMEDILQSVPCNSPWHRTLLEDLPKRYHFPKSLKVEDILLDLKPWGKLFAQDASDCKNDLSSDNVDPIMQGTFIGFGPDLRMNYTTASFRNIELYNLMCKLLDIEPAPNNGTLGSLEHMLCQPSTKVHMTDFEAILKEETHGPPKKPPRPKKLIDGVLQDSEIERVCVCDARDPQEIYEFSPTTFPVTTSPETFENLLRRSNRDLDLDSILNPTQLNNDETEIREINRFTSDINTHMTSTISTISKNTTPHTTTLQVPLPTSYTITPQVPLATTTYTTTPQVPVATSLYTATRQFPLATSYTPTTRVPVATTTYTTIPQVPLATTTYTTTPPVPVAASLYTDTRQVPLATSPSTTTPQVPLATTLSQQEQTYLSLLLNRHVPWGTPDYSAVEGNSGKVQVLLHTNYVIGLHEAINLGLWVSFTIDNETISLVKADAPKITVEDDDEHKEIQIDFRPPPCWRADSRLSRSLEDQCHRMLTKDLYQSKTISLIQLFPEELETREMTELEGHLLSNMAPVRAGYVKARRAMIDALEHWATERQDLNVIHGPVFDYDYDGHRDSVRSVLNSVKPLVPSDYFYIVSSCKGSLPVAECPSDELEILAFVFPNSDSGDNDCPMSDAEYLHYHLTNIRDIELLTGLFFFRKTYWNWQDTLMLKAAQPFKIWPLPSTSHLIKS